MSDTEISALNDAASMGATPSTAPTFAIELSKINKAFGPVRANKDVDLQIRTGCVHGIIGENGAGKSTLMSILYGFYEADSGSTKVNGKPVNISTPQAAIDAGIGMVHQHFMLIDTFTVLENIVLGAETDGLLQTSLDTARLEMERLEEEYGLYVNLDTLTGDLPVGEQQRVEILKALYRGAKILILDEPTGVLTPQETDQLFKILDALQKQGVTIVLITHKLREIMAITDNVSVMRGGEMVAHRETAKTTKEELAELMIGRKVRSNSKKDKMSDGKIFLSVNNVTIAKGLSVPLLDDISFDVRAGEIVGIAGVSGNGQSELLEVISGIRSFDAGHMTLNGRDISPGNLCDPKEVRTLKTAHVPEDRHRLGMVTDFSAKETAILGYHDTTAYNSGLLLDTAFIETECARLMEEFDVRPRLPDIKSANMSGGNQQKLILARELDKDPQVLLVGQPTRGVDIGAIEFIHQQLFDLRDAGAAILMVSVELDEIMALSDRIIVMFGGRIVAEIDASEADEKTLGLMMANAWNPDTAKDTEVVS